MLYGFARSLAHQLGWGVEQNKSPILSDGAFVFLVLAFLTVLVVFLPLKSR